MVHEAQINRAVELMSKRSANYAYFFSKLSTPDWIRPLQERHFFALPPVPTSEGTSVSFPFWPQSEYLSRMAAQVPSLVLDVIQNIPETDNIRVHANYCEAACKMPGTLAARLAKGESAWLETQSYIYSPLPDQVGELITHLARSGEQQAAIRLARALLLTHRRSRHVQPRPRFDIWQYEQLLEKRMPALFDADPTATFELLCELLANVLMTEESVVEPPDDYSYIWRPAIEDHAQNGPHYEYRDGLVGAVRDYAVRLISDQLMAPGDVLSALDRRGWYIFVRIGLHALVECNGLAPTEASNKVLTKVNFDCVQLRHEYRRLQRVMFPKFSRSQQDTILQWIEESTAASAGDPSRSDQFMLHKLINLDGLLPQNWQSKLDELRKGLGEPEHPEFPAYMTTSWMGPTSPLDSMKLPTMSSREVAKFCREWEPSHSWQLPTREGLARQLASDVKIRPAEYVSNLLEFIDTDPTYARGVVEGLTEAAKVNATINWQLVFDFLEWIIGQDSVLQERSSDPLDEDPHWGWAKRAVVDLIRAGCEQSSFPNTLRERIWSILETMTLDPDPTEADDKQSTMDAPTRSINTTRGRALHAVLHFACWERRASGVRQGPAVLPAEVRGVLEEHLNPDKETSPAVRSVYGQWLPSLFALDPKWVEAHLTQIFPCASEQAQLRAVVWDTYLDFSNVYYDVFDILRDQYTIAVAAVSKADSPKRHQRNSNARLGEHLMVLAAGGKIAWDDSDGLLRQFFMNVADTVAEKALAYFGHSLRRNQETVAPEVIERMTVLWERILDAVEHSHEISCEPLKAFESWFGSGCFDATWAVEKLLQVVRLGAKLDAYGVFRELERIAKSNLSLAFTALSVVLANDRTGWNTIGSKDQIRAILAPALKDENLSETARLLVHELGAREHFDFRDLLVGKV